MSYTRWARGVRNLGNMSGGTSRLARPPAVLEEPDIRPRRAVCWSHVGFAESENSYTMSPDGTLIYGGLSTDYNIWAFDVGGWSFVGSVELESIHGVLAPDPVDRDWNFVGGYTQASVVLGDGLMCGYDVILELDDDGETVPGADYHGALMRWDPADGSAFEVLYHWSEDANSTSSQAMVWWHPDTPDLVWVVKEFGGVVDLLSYDVGTDTMSMVESDIWSAPAAIDLQGFSVFEYDDGFVWVLRSLDGATDDYRICNYHLPSSTLSTLDFDTVGGTVFDGYPFGADYSGRLLFTSTLGQIDGYRTLAATIGDLTAYGDCDVFAYTDEFGTSYTQVFYWFAPAGRAVVYSTDGYAVFSQTP